MTLSQIDAAYAEALQQTGSADAHHRQDDQGQGLLRDREQGTAGTARRCQRTWPQRAIQELGGERHILVNVHAAGAQGNRSQRPAPEPLQLPIYDEGNARSRPAQPMAMRSRRWAQPESEVVAPGWRGQQLDLRRDFRQSLPRPLLRAVHRRAAAGRRGGRPAGARLRPASPPPSPRSSPAPTTSSAWRRSRAPTSASAARTRASPSARMAPRRWRSKTWR